MEQRSAGWTDRAAPLRFVPHERLARFLASDKYIPAVAQVKTAFQASGVFVSGRQRFTLGEFLPGMFLGPPTLARLRARIPRVRPLFVSGVVLRSSDQTPLSLRRFFDAVDAHQGDVLPLAPEDLVTLGPVIGDPDARNATINGSLRYELFPLTNNPFESRDIQFRYYARQFGDLLDVFVVSDRKLDLSKLRVALEWLGTNGGDWVVLSVDDAVLPTTDSRHQLLQNLSQVLNNERSLVPRGVFNYKSSRAPDLGEPLGDEFDRSHQQMEGDVRILPLQTVMDALVERRYYLAKAEMLFYGREEDGGGTMYRIELYIKLVHKRVDISFIEARALEPGQADTDIETKQDFRKLEIRPVPDEGAMLRDLWTTLGPVVVALASAGIVSPNPAPPGTGTTRSNRPRGASSRRTSGAATT